LRGGRLPQIGADDITHEHLVNLFRIHSSALHCILNGDRSQLNGSERRKRSPERADGRTRHGYDEYFSHDFLFMMKKFLARNVLKAGTKLLRVAGLKDIIFSARFAPVIDLKLLP
jgi:hypothetical protein